MKLVRNIVVAIAFPLSAVPVAAQDTNADKDLFIHKQIERQHTRLSEGVYAFMGYSSSNFGVIRSEHGYILIDTGDNLDGVEAAAKEITTLAPGQLQAIILTHSHPDHRAGAEAFLKNSIPSVPIWAHKDFGAEQKTMQGLEQVASARFNRQFGNAIPDSLYIPNFMTPHFPNHRSGKLITPNHFVKEGKTELTIDGVKLEIHTIPGESADHLTIWMPKEKVLFCGDNVYGCFPNIYPIRGGTYRDVERWAKGVRRLLDFDARAAMCGHNLALKGNEVKQVFSDYAEAIEYVYNSTMKGMNEGKTPEELCRDIKLPKHLQGKMYLGEFYGAIDWTIRSIYAAKLGWFDGNPTHLFPLTMRQEAEKMAKLVGGESKLVNAAEMALTDNDYQWAMKLADYLMALEREEGKIIKISAMRQMSKQVLPISGINYLMQSSLEMQNQ